MLVLRAAGIMGRTLELAVAMPEGIVNAIKSGSPGAGGWPWQSNPKAMMVAPACLLQADPLGKVRRLRVDIAVVVF